MNYMGVEADFGTFYEKILIGGVMSLVFSHIVLFLLFYIFIFLYSV